MIVLSFQVHISYTSLDDLTLKPAMIIFWQETDASFIVSQLYAKSYWN